MGNSPEPIPGVSFISAGIPLVRICCRVLLGAMNTENAIPGASPLGHLILSTELSSLALELNFLFAINACFTEPLSPLCFPSNLLFSNFAHFSSMLFQNSLPSSKKENLMCTLNCIKFIDFLWLKLTN